MHHHHHHHHHYASSSSINIIIVHHPPHPPPHQSSTIYSIDLTHLIIESEEIRVPLTNRHSGFICPPGECHLIHPSA